MKTIICGLNALLVLTACGLSKGFDGTGYIADPTITQAPATPSQCPYGGITVSVNSGVPEVICNGATGLPGLQGPTGQTGQTGSPGIDITPITFIQFCPGTPSYPSSFPEIGICVNGSIYAVYSANGGFLTYTPPGVYNSNGIGVSCTFTILPNCGILN